VTVVILFLAGCVCGGCGQATIAAGSGSTTDTATSGASTATTPATSSSSISASAPAAFSNAALKSATERLIAAYNEKNPRAVCSSFTPQTMAWMARFMHDVFGVGAACKRFVAVPFHPQTSDTGDTTPAFGHVAVLRWIGFGRVGGFGEATAIMRPRFPGIGLRTPMSNPQVVTFWYADAAGKLLLARMPPIGQVLQGTDPDPSENLAPLTPAQRAVPAIVGVPQFACSGDAQSSSDAPNDVDAGDGAPITHTDAPWLDIRRVTGIGVNGSQPCIQITLAAPLRPGTEITVNGNDYLPAIIAFNSQDDFATGFGGFRAHATHMIGERGKTVVLALAVPPKPSLDAPFNTWSICVSQVRAFDPLSYSLKDVFDRWVDGDPSADNGNNGDCVS
jgi:hypothetical protein